MNREVLLKRGALTVAVAGCLTVMSSGAAAAVRSGPDAPDATANLLKNGGFEKPAAQSGGYDNFSSGDSFPGWMVVGPSGCTVDLLSDQYSGDGLTFDSQSGAQSLDLTGGSQTKNCGVSHTVATTVKASYTLTFWVGNVYDHGGEYGTSSTVKVTVDGKQLTQATNSGGKGSSSMVWKEFTKTFTAATADTTVAFLNEDPAGDTSNGLDAVSLSKN